MSFTFCDCSTFHLEGYSFQSVFHWGKTFLIHEMESCCYPANKGTEDLELVMSFIGVGEDPERPALPDVLRADSPAVCPIEIPSSMHNQMEMPHNRKLSYCEMEQGIRMTRMAEAGYPGNMPGYVHFINVEGGPNTPDSGYISENLSPVNAAFYPEQKVMTLQDPNVQQFSDDAPAFNDADMTSFNDACQRCQSCPPTMVPQETYDIDTGGRRPHGSQYQVPDAVSGGQLFLDWIPVLQPTEMEPSTSDQQYQAGHQAMAEKKPIYRAPRQSNGKRKRKNAKEKQKPTTSSTKTTKSVNNASKTPTDESVTENARRGDDESIRTGPNTTGKEDDKTSEQTDKVDAPTIMVSLEEDTMSDRPLPVLIAEPNLPTDSINPDNYISGTFDHNGGHLSLPRLEVKLFIPPGAIPRGMQQEIFMYVSWENKHQPRDKTGKTKLSPVVVCGPNGLQFRENVCLSFTHCIDPADKWKLTPVYTATDIDEPSNYQMLVDPDKETHEQSAMCLLDKETLSILVDHFTGYGLLGEEPQNKKGAKKEPLKQYMSCMVYIVKQEKDIQLRVYLVKKLSGAEQWVEHEEKKVVPGGTKCEMTKYFTLMATGNDVEVEIDNVTDRWKLFPNDKKILLLPYGCLWDTDHYGCTFTLILDESCDASTMPSFRCTISIKQKGSDDGMQTEFAICQSPFQAQVTTPKREAKQASLPYSVRLELSHLLDFEHPLGNDWRKLPEWLGYDHSVVRLFEAQRRFKSPTFSALTVWECRRGTLTAASIIELHDFLASIDRNDAAGVLRSSIESTFGKIDDIKKELSLSQACASRDYSTTHNCWSIDSGYVVSPFAPNSIPRSVGCDICATPKPKKIKTD